MLEVFPNIIPDGVDKGFALTQTLAKKGLEFFPGDGDISFIFHLLLVLLLAKQGGILDESGGKWHLILTLDLGNSKMVFTLLEEIIAL